MIRRVPVYGLAAAALIVIGSVLTLARERGLLQPMELAAYDAMVAVLADTRPLTVPIALVLVGEADIQALGNWPLTDAQLADAIEALLALEPRAIGIDIYRDLPVGADGHARLARLLAGHSALVAIEMFPKADSPGIPPPSVLRGTEQVGFSDLVVDADGVVRRNLLFQTVDDRVGYALSVRLALLYLARQGVFPQPDASDPSLLRLGDVTLMPLTGHEGGYSGADAGGYQVVLDYGGEPMPFPVYSLADLGDGAVPAAAVRDGIVIVGVASDSVRDFFATPFSRLDPRAGLVPGSVVHAHAARQLLDAALAGREPLRSWPRSAQTAWIWLWTAAGCVFGAWLASVWRLALVALLGLVAVAGAALQLLGTGWWVASVAPAAGWLLGLSAGNALAAARRRREYLELRSLFATQVSPQVAEMIWQRRDDVLVDGRVRPQTLPVTLLFSDVQGFTRVSEQMDPEPFLDWLNSYLSALTETIMRHGGVLDDYAGDGIKANFGVPLARRSAQQIAADAAAAVRCACDLAADVSRLNRQWQSQGRPPVALRVGIHSGQAVAGSVGSAARMKFTTVGRDVNLASRLESLQAVDAPDAGDETCNCRILISADSARLLGGRFELADLGEHRLKGISAPTRVYRVECRSVVASEAGRE